MHQDHTIALQPTASGDARPGCSPRPRRRRTGQAAAGEWASRSPGDMGRRRASRLALPRQSIREHGLQTPVVFLEGRILDGRNRWRACRLAGVEPRTRIFPADGDPPAACPEPAERVVLSANLHRRHLTTSQRALLAAKIANLPHGGANKKQGTNSSLAPSIDEVADKLSVGRTIVKLARTVLQDPAQTRAVEAGEKTIHAAVSEIRTARSPRTTQAAPIDPTGFDESSEIHHETPAS
jgi:hypothetical protein